MKFLVLALCVCAASAASFYKPQQFAKAAAETAATPFVAAGKAAYSTAQVVAEAPVVAAKAVVNAANQIYATGKESDAAVLRFDSDVAADSYKYFYETGNGIAAQAEGVARKVGDEEVLVVQGSYRFSTPDGQVVEISYVADENGYQPKGDSIPVGPAIPEAIIRSLEYIRTHPSKEVY